MSLNGYEPNFSVDPLLTPRSRASSKARRLLCKILLFLRYRGLGKGGPRMGLGAVLASARQCCSRKKAVVSKICDRIFDAKWLCFQALGRQREERKHISCQLTFSYDKTSLCLATYAVQPYQSVYENVQYIQAFRYSLSASVCMSSLDRAGHNELLYRYGSAMDASASGYA